MPTASAPASSLLHFKGHQGLRQRLVLATLSGKSIRVSNIRSDGDQEATGLTDYEASFLRLLEKVTNGSVIEINYTGTMLTYHPGNIVGGVVNHECPTSRAIGYFVEPLVVMAPFAKSPLNLTISGVTNDNADLSVDLIRTVLLPQLVRFGVSDSAIELKVLKRGARPLGGGQINLKIPNVRALKSVQFVDGGLVNRIRGIAYCTRISPLMANRMQEAARSVLTRFIPDVYIYTDVYKGAESGLSPGYALSLVAETNTQAILSTECAYRPRKHEDPAAGAGSASVGVEDSLVNDYNFPTPEDLGVRAARQLMTEIKKGGTVDTISQWLNLVFIALGPENVGKVRIGALAPFTVGYLRDIEAFLGVRFKISPDRESGTVLLSSMGIGYVNVNKAVS